jgi:hypothetical protein
MIMDLHHDKWILQFSPQPFQNGVHALDQNMISGCTRMSH